MPPKTSPVYGHFADVEGDIKRMRCKHCDALITKKSSNLVKHLKTSHGQIYDDYGKEKGTQEVQKRKNDDEVEASVSKQPRITTFFGSSIVMDHCVSLVVDSGRPFSLFNDKGQKALINLAKLQTGEKVAIYPESVKEAVSSFAEKKRIDTRKALSGKLLSLSLDMATCRHRSFIGLNAQLFVDGKIQVFCLQCREVNERHTAINIQKWIGEGQRAYDISNEQILALAIDSARNMTRAVDDFIVNLTGDEPTEEEVQDQELLEYDNDPSEMIEVHDNECELLAMEDEEDDSDDSIGSAVRMHCVAHKLQLAINDFLKRKPNARLVLIAQKLAAKLRNPNVRPLIIDANLKQPVLDQKTRWSSTYLMIDRLLELKSFCDLKAPLLKGLYVAQQQWEDLEVLRDVLKPLAELTTRLQHEQLDVTQFVAFWKFAMFSLEKQRSSKAVELRKCVEEREKLVFNNRLIQCAIYLDKRYSFTLSPDEITQAKEFVLHVWKKRKNLANDAFNDEDEEAEIEPDTESERNSALDEYQDYMSSLARSKSKNEASHASTTRKNKNIIEAELRAFDSLDNLPVNTQIVEYWKDQKEFLVLKQIALDIISVPVTEVSVERLFSHLNFILNVYRSTLKAEILQDILCSRMNKKFEM